MDITKSNYRKLSCDIDFLYSILTLTDAFPKNLTHVPFPINFKKLAGSNPNGSCNRQKKIFMKVTWLITWLKAVFRL